MINVVGGSDVVGRKESVGTGVDGRPRVGKGDNDDDDGSGEVGVEVGGAKVGTGDKEDEEEEGSEGVGTCVGGTSVGKGGKEEGTNDSGSVVGIDEKDEFVAAGGCDFSTFPVGVGAKVGQEEDEDVNDSSGDIEGAGTNVWVGLDDDCKEEGIVGTSEVVVGVNVVKCAFVEIIEGRTLLLGTVDGAEDVAAVGTLDKDGFVLIVGDHDVLC